MGEGRKGTPGKGEPVREGGRNRRHKRHLVLSRETDCTSLGAPDRGKALEKAWRLETVSFWGHPRS